MPGGRAVLFTITAQTGGLETAQVAVRDLRTGTQKVLLRGGSHGLYVASGPGSPKRGEGGHLVYVAAGTLRAIPFDPIPLETHGTAVPVLARLATTSFGAGDFALAADGTLVYVEAPASLAANASRLVWVDRTGKEEPVAAPPHAYQHPRLSPDGTRIAISRWKAASCCHSARFSKISSRWPRSANMRARTTTMSSSSMRRSWLAVPRNSTRTSFGDGVRPEKGGHVQWGTVPPGQESGAP